MAKNNSKQRKQERLEKALDRDIQDLENQLEINEKDLAKEQHNGMGLEPCWVLNLKRDNALLKSLINLKLCKMGKPIKYNITNI